MYCQLGYLAFERREYVEALEGTTRHDFAEHAHVEGKPGLQAIGDGLDTYQLDMVFHHGWCDPAASIAKMKEVAARKEAQALVWGDGTYYGRFVVTELVKTWRHTRPTGELLFAVLRIQLKEHVDPEPLVTTRKRAAAKAPAVKTAAAGKAGKTKAKPGVKAKAGGAIFTEQTTTNPDGFPVTTIVRK